MQQKPDLATRCSKRQKGEDASVESLKTQRRRKNLVTVENDLPAEETSPDLHTTIEKPAFEEEHAEEDSEKDEENEVLEEEARVETAKHVETEDRQQSTEAGQAEQAETMKKRTRGRTRMSKVAKNHEDKVEVEFISLGEHVGAGSVTLSSFLGPLVREHVPVLLEDWRRLEEQTKYTMWEEIQVLFHT